MASSALLLYDHILSFENKKLPKKEDIFQTNKLQWEYIISPMSLVSFYNQQALIQLAT